MNDNQEIPLHHIRKHNAKPTIEIPAFYLPKELQKLHEEIAETRFELREKEIEFRKQLGDFFSKLS